MSTPLKKRRPRSKATRKTNRSRTTRYQRAVARQPLIWLGILLIGVNLIISGALYLAYEHTVLSFQVAPTLLAKANLRGSVPTQIEIESATINLPILPVQIHHGIWDIPSAAAGFLDTSARPAEGGNIIVYAHNKRQLFGPLVNVKIGDIITINTDKNIRYDYQVKEKMIVKADDITVVTPTNYEVLTVYTCTGWLDSQRLVLKALPVKVSSI